MEVQFEWDREEFKALVNKFKYMSDIGFKKFCYKYLDTMGEQLLDEIVKEIKKNEHIVSGLLIRSFKRGHEENHFKLDLGKLELEVGSITEYAGFVNDGHWLNPQGTEKSFVSGYWTKKGHFKHDPNAKSGMVVTQRWIEGSHYFDNAVDVIEKLMPEKFEEMLEAYYEGIFAGLEDVIEVTT